METSQKKQILRFAHDDISRSFACAQDDTALLTRIWHLAPAISMLVSGSTSRFHLAQRPLSLQTLARRAHRDPVRAPVARPNR